MRGGRHALLSLRGRHRAVPGSDLKKGKLSCSTTRGAQAKEDERACRIEGSRVGVSVILARFESHRRSVFQDKDNTSKARSAYPRGFGGGNVRGTFRGHARDAGGWFDHCGYQVEVRTYECRCQKSSHLQVFCKLQKSSANYRTAFTRRRSGVRTPSAPL